MMPRAWRGIAELTVDRTTIAAAIGAKPKVLWRSIVGVSMLVGVLLLTAVAASAPGAAPRQSSRFVGAASGGIAWSGCGKRLQCAKVRVPLDWSHPGGRKITLAVIRYLATRRRERIGSLFFNPGGPGNSGVDFVKAGGGALLNRYGQDRFDVVSWDIRGTNASTRVRCFKSERSQARFWDGLSVPTGNSASRRFRRKTAAYARRCGDLSGSLLRHLSNADMVRDLDYLRRLVGDRRLNYYGVSYGTLIGETYANMFPRRVRAMVIDGLINPVAYTRGSESAVANNTSDSDRVFDEFQSLCQRVGPTRCALAGHGSVRLRVENLLRRLRHAPIPAPSAHPAGALTYGDFLVELFAQLGHPGAWPELARELNQAADGDGSALATASRQFFRLFRAGPNGDGFSAVWCADSPARQGSRAWPSVIRRLTRASRTRGPVLGWWAWAPCASWPVRSADRYTGPWNATTKTPVLVMGINNDPNTPFASARRVARMFGNAVLLTQQGYGHGTYTDPSACIDAAMGRYLVDLVTPPRGTVCRSDRQPFEPDFG
jgi:pimeloyl-ACP methyl ester carboxylesterase